MPDLRHLRARLRQDTVLEGLRSLTPVRFAPEPLPAAKRWPWAVAAAVLGAVAGAGCVLLLRRLVGQDAPDAQEPGELRAVVDTDVPAA